MEVSSADGTFGRGEGGGDAACASSLSAGTNMEKGLSITVLCKTIQEAARSSSLCVSQGGVGEAGVCLLDSACCLGLKIAFQETSEM